MSRLAATLLALLALAGCGGDDSAPPEAVQDLPDLETLRSDFEAAEGKTRLVLLFAPT